MALSQALREAGDRVCLVCGEDSGPVDRAVSINDANLLPVNAARRFVWFHNEVEFWKETRRGRLPALLRYRPDAVFVGAEQARLASRLLPLGRRTVIPHGLSAHILAAEPANTPPAPHGVFTSQAYRGLRETLAMWRDLVAPAVAEARFSAFIAPRDVAAFPAGPGIEIRARVPNDAMPAVLRGARVWVAPGHPSETFCMAAAEAVAMGVPVVTLGAGALRERVRHGVDGFICADMAEMAARTIEILTDDALWQRLHAAGLAARQGQGWAEIARLWRAL